MRVSCTQLESFRLWRSGDWMPEQDLIDSITGVFVPNHKINLGSAFGKVLEDPQQYAVSGGYRVRAGGEDFEFGVDVMLEPLSLLDRRGVFEAKTVKAYGPVDVVSKADYIAGARLREFKTTLSTFDFDKYAESCQWRFMADAFQPRIVTYHIFCLEEAKNGVIGLKEIHTFNLFPYAALHDDCARLVREFTDYVDRRGLRAVLEQRQREAA